MFSKLLELRDGSFDVTVRSDSLLTQGSNPEYSEESYLFLERQLELYKSLCYVSIMVLMLQYHKKIGQQF